MVETINRPPTGGGGPNPRDGTATGRLAYPRLLVPTKFGEKRNVPGSGSGEPKYGCSIVAAGNFVKPMRDAVQAVMRAVIDDIYRDSKQLPPRGLRGTAKKDPIIKSVADYSKMWPDAPDDAIFIRTSSLDMPGFFDAQVKPLSVEEARLLFIPGCWVRVAFRAFHFTEGGDPGIGLALNHLQYLRPGPRFGTGRTAPGDVFSPFDDDDPLFADLDV
jgi:hypothetical protein